MLNKRDLIETEKGEVYFVADVSIERGKAALVDVKDWHTKNSQYKKPFNVTLHAASQRIQSGKWTKCGKVKLPAMMLKSDKWFEFSGKSKWLSTRDKKYRIINSVILDRDILERYIYGEGISEEILAIKERLKVKSVGGIYRDINRYLTFGATPNALLPIQWAKCGNRITWQNEDGKTIKRGTKTRKNRHGQRVPCRSKTRGVEPQDSLNILLLLKEYEIYNQASYKAFSKEKLWDEFNRRFQSHIIIRNGPGGEDYYPWTFNEEERISRSQFFYHLNKLLSDEQELKIKLGKIRFQKDKAVKTGLARDGIVGAGHCYAIDATILDVYVRFPYDPEIKSCGRPVLYLVVDVWSTCIVGFYLGFHGPDWTGAAEALYHACINKSEWAKMIGWHDFKDGSWNCHHVPSQILCDNGSELSEINTLSVMDAEIGIAIFNYAPIFRGDAKSIVERKFGVVNTSFINFQPGYVYKEALRELPHAAQDSTWDYRSLLIAIGREIVYHNNNVNRLKLHNFSMSRAGIGITPQAIYDYSINHEMEGGTVEEDKARLRFAFLREETATVHGDCVKHSGLEYEFPNGEELGIYAKAKYGKTYKIPVRITNATVNYIWYRDDDSQIHQLKLKDPDHWAMNQRREIVMERLEQYENELFELTEKALQKRLELLFHQDMSLVNNLAKIINFSKSKGMPARMDEAKQMMAALCFDNIAKVIQVDFNKGKRPEPSDSSDTEYEFYENYAS